MAKSGLTKIEFNDDGIKAMFQCDGLRQVMEQQTERVTTEANANGDCDGFVGQVVMGRIGRYVGLVRASDKKSMKAASEDKALERALHQ